jgi:hypothetical protein
MMFPFSGWFWTVRELFLLTTSIQHVACQLLFRALVNAKAVFYRAESGWGQQLAWGVSVAGQHWGIRDLPFSNAVELTLAWFPIDVGLLENLAHVARCTTP